MIVSEFMSILKMPIQTIFMQSLGKMNSIWAQNSRAAQVYLWGIRLKDNLSRIMVAFDDQPKVLGQRLLFEFSITEARGLSLSRSLSLSLPVTFMSLSISTRPAKVSSIKIRHWRKEEACCGTQKRICTFHSLQMLVLGTYCLVSFGKTIKIYF